MEAELFSEALNVRLMAQCSPTSRRSHTGSGERKLVYKQTLK